MRSSAPALGAPRRPVSGFALSFTNNHAAAVKNCTVLPGKYLRFLAGADDKHERSGLGRKKRHSRKIKTGKNVQ